MKSSLPHIKRKYLTSNNTNEEFMDAYELRKQHLEDEIDSLKNKISKNRDRLKELDEKEKSILHGNTSPKANQNKPAPNQTNQTIKAVEDPKMKDKSIPSGNTNAKANQNNPAPNQTNQTMKAVEDPKMKELLPIYKEKRHLKEKYEAYNQQLAIFSEKKGALFKQYANLQIRQNILKSVNVEPEVIKRAKLGKSLNKSKRVYTVFAKPEEREIDLEKLKYAKRGFYLDILETASTKKVLYDKDDIKYDVDAYAQVRKDQIKDNHLKFSQVQLRAKANQAMKEPYLPENTKILKESQMLRESLAKSQIIESQILKEEKKVNQANRIEEKNSQSPNKNAGSLNREPKGTTMNKDQISANALNNNKTNKEEPKKQDNTKKVEETKKIESTKKLEDQNKVDTTKKAEEPKKVDTTKKAEDPKIDDSTKKEDQQKKTDSTKKVEDPKKVDTTKKQDEQKNVNDDEDGEEEEYE